MEQTLNTKIQTKNAFFFSHDSNARNDEKIIHLRMRMGAEGYGIYFMLIEMLLESSDYELTNDYEVLGFALQIDKEKIARVVEEFGLFEFSDEGYTFSSPSFLRRIEPLQATREKRRQAGIKSGEARREKARIEAEKAPEEQNRTYIEQSPNISSQKTNRGEESRAEERKVEQRRARLSSHPLPTNPQALCHPCSTRWRTIARKEKIGWMLLDSSISTNRKGGWWGATK